MKVVPPPLAVTAVIVAVASPWALIAKSAVSTPVTASLKVATNDACVRVGPGPRTKLVIVGAVVSPAVVTVNAPVLLPPAVAAPA